MNYSTYRFTLDIHKSRSQVSIPVMYQDTWVRFYINLTDGGKPYTLDGVDTAVLFGKKSDGSPLSKECVISADKTRIEYTFNEQTASVIGSVACEIRLYSKSGLHLTTPSFVILVEERVVEDEDLVESVPDLSAIDSIFMSESEREEAEAARKEAEDGRADAETARVEAEAKRQELADRMEEHLEQTTDQEYNPESEKPQSGKAVAQAIEAIPKEKEVVNITTIDETYETVEDLPRDKDNGTTLLVMKDKCLYAWNSDAGEWVKKYELRAHTLYCVLTGTNSGIYRYTMSRPYLVLAEQAAIEAAKEYTDARAEEHFCETKGYYWSHIDLTNKKIYLSKTAVAAKAGSGTRDTTLEKPAYAPGGRLCLINDKAYYHGSVGCSATILSVENNIINYTGDVGFTEVAAVVSYVFVIEQPSIGEKVIYSNGFGLQGAGALGEKTFVTNNGCALGGGSSVFGSQGLALGLSSFVGGLRGVVRGNYGFGFGRDVVVEGQEGVAFGLGTVSTMDRQFVIGQHNLRDDAKKYRFIIGGGYKPEAPANLHTVDESGNAWYSGNVFAGSARKQLATKESVDSLKTKLDNVTNVMDFVGVSSTDPLKGGATVGDTKTFQKGDVVLHGNNEYVYDGNAWHEYGNATALSASVSELGTVLGDLQTRVSVDEKDFSDYKSAHAKDYTNSCIDALISNVSGTKLTEYLIPESKAANGGMQVYNSGIHPITITHQSGKTYKDVLAVSGSLYVRFSGTGAGTPPKVNHYAEASFCGIPNSSDKFPVSFATVSDGFWSIFLELGIGASIMSCPTAIVSGDGTITTVILEDVTIIYK